MYKVSLVKYSEPYISLKNAVERIGGLNELPSNTKVFIKPNFVVWLEGIKFPKYGVITTARMINDLIFLLNEFGITDITIIEGIGKIDESSDELLKQATKAMGLDRLSKKYGVKFIDVHESTFFRCPLDDITVSVNEDILNADYVINIPVLKTHSQCKVSLGIKNLKGLIAIDSRKKCHCIDNNIDLDYCVSKFAKMLSPGLTIVDGIYALECGPLFFGKAHRSNLILASKDLISADKVGATILGYQPDSVPHISLAMSSQQRISDLSDIELKGDIQLDEALKPLRYRWKYNEIKEIPHLFESFGIKGIRFPEYDKTLCTYCVPYYAYTIAAILMSASKRNTFDDIEILTGKIQKPSGMAKHTLLLGQCQVKLNKRNPAIRDCVMVKGCPPNRDEFIHAFSKMGVELPEKPLEWMNNFPSQFMAQYNDQSEFDENFYKVN